MALFEGAKLRDKTQYPRSQTKLVVSGGDSPAEKWIVDDTLATLFKYPYYGWYGPLQDVVVSKGMMVALTGKIVRDYDTGRYIPQLTIADGTNATVGMAPFNFIRPVADRFYANQPSIITREYVELPLFPALADAQACKWGSVHGDTGVKVAAGDYLKVSAGAPGRLTKWDKANDGVEEVVGQVLGIEDNGAPNSWLNWAMWDETAKQQDETFINKSGQSAPSDAGYPFDANYKNGTLDMPGYWDEYTTTTTGVPGINDGTAIRNTQYTDIEIGYIAAGTASGVTLTFVAPTQNLQPGTVSLKVGGVAQVLNTDFTVDHTRGLIYYKTKALGANDQVTLSYKTMGYGTPSGWDFAGAAGAVRLLLKF